jgi:hypothetical protein
MNTLAISQAIAAAVAAATPPTGEDQVRLATARMPNTIGMWPSFVIEPGPEDIEWLPNRQRWSTFTFEGVLYRQAVGDLAERVAALEAWRDVLRDVTLSQVQLGLVYIQQALPVATDVGPVDYNGVDHDGVTVTWEVKVREIVTGAAA